MGGPARRGIARSPLQQQLGVLQLSLRGAAGASGKPR